MWASLVACDAALSQRLTRLQCFGRNSGDDDDDDSDLIHAAAMSGQQFDEVLQAKVALLQPALHTGAHPRAREPGLPSCE